MDKNVDRISFLLEKYNVFDDSLGEMSAICDYLTLKCRLIETTLLSKENKVFALLSRKAVLNTSDSNDMTLDDAKKDVRVDVSSLVFNMMVESDPTKNKMYTQWMLNVFIRHIKNGEHDEAERFFSEDLPLAKEYLILFDRNKRKKKFRNR